MVWVLGKFGQPSYQLLRQTKEVLSIFLQEQVLSSLTSSFGYIDIKLPIDTGTSTGTGFFDV